MHAQPDPPNAPCLSPPAPQPSWGQATPQASPSGKCLARLFCAVLLGAVLLAGTPGCTDALADGDERFPEAELVAAASLPEQTVCGAESVPVSRVQGPGASSPLRGQRVVTEGVVTAVWEELGGFHLQDPVGDGDPTTSEGVFVFVGQGMDSGLVLPGQSVRVGARVAEYYGHTQLSQLEWLVPCGRGDVAPTPFPAGLLDAATLEAHEGMLVRFQEPLTIVSSRQLGRFGELQLSPVGRRYWSAGSSATERSTPVETADPVEQLVLDDGSEQRDPRPVPYLHSGSSPRLGDEVDSLEGVLGFAYGSYRVHPTGAVRVLARNPRPVPPTRKGELRVAALNVGNYFLTLGSRGASTPSQLERQRRGLVAALQGLDADVLALAEVENDGGGAILDLAQALNELSADPYAVVPTGPLGSDAIRVALLYRPSRVTPRGAPFTSAAITHVRPPLAQTFRWGERHLTVASVHFKSRSCSGAAGEELDPGDGSGCFHARRAAEARSLVEFLERAQRRAGDAALVVLGDVNTYPGERPLELLLESGLTDLLAPPGSPSELPPEPPPYSYVFDGRAGLLDHALATPSVRARAVQAGVWHINADEPAILHALSSPEPADPLAVPPYRSSDHDPVFVDLTAIEGTEECATGKVP